VFRWLPAALALALLAASALAFAYTERLKVEPSPVTGTLVDKVFSPVCDCPTDTAVISFRLRKPALVTVDVLDAQDRSVRTLVRGDSRPAGRVTYRWDGRDDGGRVLQEGSYRPRVRLAERGRTIVLPNPMRIDVTAPSIRLLSVRPSVFSPNADGRNDRISARYEMTDRATPVLLADGRQRVVGLFQRRVGKLDWNGDGVGSPPRQGVVEIAMRATDPAGNRSSTSRAVPIVVRYIALARHRIAVKRGEGFAIGVVTDMPSYRWRFAGKAGRTGVRTLRLRAPNAPGRYMVFVRAQDGHADSAAVVVREAA
jgi:hypothetical protein